MPPGKALGDILLGLKALHKLDDLEVRDRLDLWVLLQVEVLGRVQYTLCSEHRGEIVRRLRLSSAVAGSSRLRGHPPGRKPERPTKRGTA